MGMDYGAELIVAQEAVIQAARLCLDVLRTSDMRTLQKGDRSPVTVADFGSQALSCRHIASVFPDDPVIAEESSAALRQESAEATRGRVLDLVSRAVPGASTDDVCTWIDRGGATEYSPRYWTLDPIDGTKGFLRGDQYAVALALIVEGKPVVACLACPNLEDGHGGRGVLVSAVRGRGVTTRALFEATGSTSLHVSDTESPSMARFCESFESGHSSHDDASAIAAELGIIHPPVRLDSQAKYAVVARGEADIYLRLPMKTRYIEKIWDHAAGSLVVEEAGGCVTDVDGKPLDFTRGRYLDANRGVIVTNGRLHERVLDALKVATGGP